MIPAAALDAGANNDLGKKIIALAKEKEFETERNGLFEIVLTAEASLESSAQPGTNSPPASSHIKFSFIIVRSFLSANLW